MMKPTHNIMRRLKPEEGAAYVITTARCKPHYHTQTMKAESKYPHKRQQKLC